MSTPSSPAVTGAAPAEAPASPGPRPGVPAGRRPAPLRRRLTLWVAATALVPAALVALGMEALHRQSESQARTAEVQRWARAVADVGAGAPAADWTRAAEAALLAVAGGPGLLLAELRDAHGVVLHRPAAGWSVPAGTTLADGLQRVPTPAGPVVVARVPVVVTVDGQGAQTRGYVTLATAEHGALAPHEPSWVVALLVLVAGGATGLIAAGVVARWTAPLTRLASAVRALASGQRPPAFAVAGRDDLAALCDMFNRMVASLFTAQDALANSHARLEQLVRQRTAEVRQANDKLEAEAQDKNEFLRAVSHDLNAPLRNIAGMAQMLLMKYREALEEDAINKLERISINAKHQTELIGDLLELSKLRTKEPRPEAVGLREVVDRIADSLSHDLEEARIELRIEGDFPTVWVERNRIRQVFQNLIDNAVKYMLDSPTRRITVSAQRTRDFEPDVFNGLDVWQFSVADTGKGISEQDLPRVFQVFARATHSGTHHVAGRGVGLASVRTIVEQVGGRVWVSSKLGEGTTFTFTLPVARVSREAAVAAAQPVSAG